MGDARRCQCIGLKAKIGVVDACGCNCRGCRNGGLCINLVKSGDRCKACK